MCLEYYSPSSDEAIVLIVTGVVSISGVLVAVLIPSKLVSQNTALQLEQEILTFATRQLEAVRDRLIPQGDDTFRPTREHQRKGIVGKDGETSRGSDDLNQASALLEHTDEHRPTNEEPEQVVSHNENQNAIAPHRLQVDIQGQEEMENDIDDEEFDQPYSEDQQIRLIE